jgi:hypothetical protein
MISMKVQATIEFPCSDEEWNSLVHMRALTSEKVSAPIVASLTPAKEAIIEALSKGQKVTADELLDTSFIDYCNNNKIAGCKPNVSQLIRDYTDANPGCTRSELVNSLVHKFTLDSGKVRQGVSNLLHNNNIKQIADRLYTV